MLDPAPPRRLDAERDRLLGEGDPASIVRALVHAPVRVEQLAVTRSTRPRRAGGGARRGARRRRLGVLRRLAGGDRLAQRWRSGSRARAVSSPLDPGLAAAEVFPSEPWAAVGAARRQSSAAGRPSCCPGRRRRSVRGRRRQHALEQELAAAGLAATKVPRRRARTVPGGRGQARPARRRFGGRPQARLRLPATWSFRECAAAGEITLARFRDLAGVGRRDAQLLLERMDVDGLTRRLGDRRVLRDLPHKPARNGLRHSHESGAEGELMAGKADFTEEEWDQLRKGATGAGLLVSGSDRSFLDTFKEATSLASHFDGSRDDDSQLVRELASESGTAGFGVVASPSEVDNGTMDALRGAVETLRAKAPDELENYRSFVLELAETVARSAEGGDEPEAATVERIRAALA